MDTKNIQGDILLGLPKKVETFWFFRINQVDQFKAGLANVVPLITSTDQAIADKAKIDQFKKSNPGTLAISFANIAFSNAGLKKLGIIDDLRDGPFTAGMFAGAQGLGDGGVGSNGQFNAGWVSSFTNTNELHGVVLVAGGGDTVVKKKLADIQAKLGLGQVTKEVYSISGKVRPGKESGHEHFGFEDGVSQPAITGFDKVELPGQKMIDPGIILLGRGDDQKSSRPSWAVDGSFLVFRQLNQMVPEFNRFLIQNAIKTNDPTISGSELLGARLNGRWKSGAPIDIVPLRDDLALAEDEQQNNDFDFDPTSPDRCPFAAHIRKMNPRSDETSQGRSVNPHRILRRGIPFGPEVTPAEAAQSLTKNDRGLLFACYQSRIDSGFQFLQSAWANNQGFPFGKNPAQTGFDPLIGQDGNTPRTMAGADPLNPDKQFNLGSNRFVVPKGGEYFFSPSISTIRDVLAKKP